MLFSQSIQKSRILIQTTALLGVLLLTACEKTPEPKAFTYPLDNGNLWEYNRTITMIFYDYEDSSGVRTQLDTVDFATYSVTTTVAGPHTFGDTLSTQEIVSQYQEDGNDISTSIYYVKTNTALLAVGYKGAGPFGYPKQVEPHQFIFNGQTFSSFARLSDALQAGYRPTEAMSDTIRFDSPPVQALAFPFKVGSEWDYRTVGHPWHMGRKVMARTNLTLDSTTYDCYQVNTRWDMHDDGAWDDDIEMIDYYAEEGLVQRELVTRGLLATDSQGMPDGRKFDIFDKYVLTNVILNSDN